MLEQALLFSEEQQISIPRSDDGLFVGVSLEGTSPLCIADIVGRLL